MHRILFFSLLLAMALSAGGCQVSPLAMQWPESRPLLRDFQVQHLPVDSDRAPLESSIAPDPTGPLTLETALRHVLMVHPILTSFDWEVRARDARALQAGLGPNPELALEFENFANSADSGVFNSTETTISIAQVVPRGDRLARAVRVAELDRQRAGWDYEAARIEIATETALAFLDVLVAQRRIELATEMTDLARRVVEVASRRVEAGVVPPSERARAQIAASTGEITLKRSIFSLQASRRVLAALWSAEPQFTEVTGALDRIFDVPDFEQLLTQLDQNPSLARWTTEIAHRRAQYQLARALAEPDITISGGIRRLGESDDTALVAQLSIPLMIVDRNQGNIAEARANVNKTTHDQQAATIAIRLAFIRGHQLLSMTHDEAITLRQDILPAAQSVFDATHRAYEQGQISWLEVIDSQRTLNELQDRYLDVLAAFFGAVIRMEALIGQSLQDLQADMSDVNATSAGEDES